MSTKKKGRDSSKQAMTQFKAYFLNGHQLPLVVEPENSSGRGIFPLLQLSQEHKRLFQADLLQYGAILFRNFNIKRLDEFEAFVRAFSGKRAFGYAGGVSPRTGLSNTTYTSTEYPAHITLNLHNELSYSKAFPAHLYFFCITAPQVGGETTLGDSRRILQRINPKTAGLFKQKQVLYERNLSANKGDGYSWQDSFETQSRHVVEEVCHRNGIDFHWHPSDILKLNQMGPATLKHPITGEEVWFNQAESFHRSALNEEFLEDTISRGENVRLNSFFGDGQEIPIEMLTSIRTVIAAETIPHRWKSDDILIVDNILTAHGRLPFSGARKIALSMT
jgi:alpha-ketoglutarate-dependent taurine dioxygenase